MNGAGDRRLRTNCVPAPAGVATTSPEADPNATALPSGLIDPPPAPSLSCDPFVVTLWRAVVAVLIVRVKESPLLLVSPDTRLVALLWNTTTSPLLLAPGRNDVPLAWTPPAPTLIRVVVAPDRLRWKMSSAALVSPATRLVADEANVTTLPSSLIGWRSEPDSPPPWAPPWARLARRVVPAVRSRRKTSPLALVSPATRAVAS